MKIAFIGHKGYPALYGGVEKVVEQMVDRLSERGHKCLVYSRNYYSTASILKRGVERIIINGLKTKRLDAISHTFLSLLDVGRRNVDIISLHSYGNAIFAFIPKYIFKQKVIIHLHGFEWRSDKWNILDKLLLKIPMIALKIFADHITTVSLEQMDILKKAGIDSTYIPNGIDYSIRNQDIPPTFKDKKYILFVGRLVNQKGVEYLIEAYNNINDYSYELYIVGDHNAAEDYYTVLLNISKKNNSIKFLGYKYGEELLSLYKYAYCIVIPSETEGNSVVLLESLSFNKCIIASKIPSIELVAKDYLIYFKNKSIEDLTEKIKMVLENPDLKNKMEKRIEKSNFESEYNWDEVITKYENIFSRVVNFV